MACHLDVTDQDSVERMVEDALGRFGRIDILVNNAGIIAAPGWEQRQSFKPQGGLGSPAPPEMGSN